jgi:hypothetical protein
MRKAYLILLLISSILYSCTKDKIQIDRDNLLLGVWNYSDYQNNVSVFTRSLDFTDNQGYKFNPDGTLVERKNSGWCGTPPVTYEDYKGTWTIISDTLIHINVGYWGGTMIYGLDIESVDSDSLKVISIDFSK